MKRLHLLLIVTVMPIVGILLLYENYKNRPKPKDSMIELIENIKPPKEVRVTNINLDVINQKLVPIIFYSIVIPLLTIVGYSLGAIVF